MTRFDRNSFTEGQTPECVTGNVSNPTTVLGTSNAIFRTNNIIKWTITGAGGAGAVLSAPTDIASIAAVSPFPAPGRQPAAQGVDATDNRIGSGPVQVGNDIFFARAVTGISGDTVQFGVLDTLTNTLISQGLIQAPNTDYYFPSITADTAGDFVIAFNGSGPTQNVSDYFAVCTIEDGVLRLSWTLGA